MCSSCRLDPDAIFRFLTTEEDSLIGHEGRAGRSYFSLLAKEPCLISTVTLSLHIGWNDPVLHILELFTEGVFSSDSTLITAIEELASSRVVLTCCVRHLILEKFLLSKLEAWVIADLLGHIFERI